MLIELVNLIASAPVWMECNASVPEENEIKQLIPLQVTPASLQAFILQHHGNISATGEPNLLMYGGWKFGEAWFEEMMGRLVNKI